MKTGWKGVSLIKRWEGMRTLAYRDAVGVWTIGYGHTAAAGPPKPVEGLRITEDEAVDLLIRDLAKYETAVALVIKRTPTQNQFDAMVSLCYNIGPGAFAKSSILRRFNAGDIKGAAAAFALWNKAGGRVLKGLTNRRADEAALFLARTDAPLPAPIPPPPDIPAPDIADAKEELHEERMGTAPVPVPAKPAGLWAWIKSWFGK